MASEEYLPAVLILGVDTPIGLTLIRELAEHNVPVYGLSTSNTALGLYSRYLKKGFVHQGDNEQLIKMLNHIAADYHIPYLMTISEQRIVFLQNNMHRLIGIKPLIPDKGVMQTVLNKSLVYKIAKSVAIEIPDNYFFADGIVELNINFPVVLKWSDPNIVIPKLRLHKIPLLKCEYSYSKEELLNSLNRYKPINQYPMIQGYCSGVGLGQMVYMHHGQAILKFQHQRIHEWPPEGGVSSLCKSIPLTEHIELFKKSILLLQALKWEGPAMVEYRHDESTGKTILMEVNGRFWGSLPLAYYANAHFAWVHYETQVLKASPQKQRQPKIIQCMFFVPEIKRLMLVFFKRNSIHDRSLDFSLNKELYVLIKHYLISGCFYVFNWRDPMPFFMDIWNSSIRRILK